MAAITYNQNIPQATDQISQSQPLILQNFTAINQLITVDHATFADINAGFHNKVTFPAQTSATFTGTDAGIYAKILSGVNEIYSHTQNFSTDIPFTKSTVSTSGKGYFYLPCGLIVCMANTPATVSGTVIVTYSSVISGFPGFKTGTTPLVFVTGVNVGTSLVASVNVSVATATEFGAYSVNSTTGSAVTTAFNWIAIGQSTSL